MLKLRLICSNALDMYPFALSLSKGELFMVRQAHHERKYEADREIRWN